MLVRSWQTATFIFYHEVPAELFKAGGDTVLDKMHRICVAIWETGEWPEEWTFSTFIPLPKKGDLLNSVQIAPVYRE